MDYRGCAESRYDELLSFSIVHSIEIPFSLWVRPSAPLMMLVKNPRQAIRSQWP